MAGIWLFIASSDAARAEPELAHPYAAPSVPQDGAWQMVTPVTGWELRDVDMVSSSDGWAVGGELGTASVLLRYNGTSWVTATIPATDVLVDVHMLDANNGYILGWNAQTTGDIYHWDGADWTHVYTATRSLNRIHASAPNNVWAVGLNITVHWDGTTWTEILPPVDRQLFAVFVPSDGTAWAFGQYVPQTNHGLVMNNITGTWNLVSNPSPQSLFDGFFSSPTDGWAAGGVNPTYVLHYDGLSWTWAYTNTYGIQRFYMFSPTSGWAIGNPAGKPYIVRFDGTNFVPVPHSGVESLNGIDMVSEYEGWIVGAAGTMLHYLKTLPTPTATSTATRTRTATPTRTTTALVSPTAIPDLAGEIDWAGTPCTVIAWMTSLYFPAGEYTEAGPSTTRLKNSKGEYRDFQVPRLTSYSHHFPGSCSIGDCVPRSWLDAQPFTLTVDVFNDVFEVNEGNNVATLDPADCTASPTPTGTATPCPISFSDVHPSDYFYEPVRYLYCMGAISGYADGTFRPFNTTTRSQLTKILVIAEGWPLLNPEVPTFNDVPTTNPFYVFVETAYDRNIISGYGCGGPGEPCPGSYFRPFNNVTRGQLCKIVVLAEGWPSDTTGGPHFNDVPTDNPFYNMIETAFNKGIISGYGCGGPGEPCPGSYFRWGNNATRGQIAKIVYNAVTAP